MHSSRWLKRHGAGVLAAGGHGPAIYVSRYAKLLPCNAICMTGRSPYNAHTRQQANSLACCIQHLQTKCTCSVLPINQVPPAMLCPTKHSEPCTFLKCWTCAFALSRVLTSLSHIVCCQSSILHWPGRRQGRYRYLLAPHVLHCTGQHRRFSCGSSRSCIGGALLGQQACHPHIGFAYLMRATESTFFDLHLHESRYMFLYTQPVKSDNVE